MIALIAAVAKNNCIGKDNKLPWHLPEDLEHFKKMTTHKIVLMGRKTYESIVNYLGKPLPNRKNIVITRNPDYQVPENVEVYNDINSALEVYKTENVFVIGGAGIYAQTIALADRLYITQVDQEVAGDAFFPDIDPTVWQETEREDHKGFSFMTYAKR